MGPEVSNIETDILLQKMDKLVQPGDWWILAGSLPVGMRADSYARMIRLINQAGARAGT
jgi:fructose-1-phosphate kinase PfkB-like protein